MRNPIACRTAARPANDHRVGHALQNARVTGLTHPHCVNVNTRFEFRLRGFVRSAPHSAHTPTSPSHHTRRFRTTRTSCQPRTPSPLLARFRRARTPLQVAPISLATQRIDVRSPPLCFSCFFSVGTAILRDDYTHFTLAVDGKALVVCVCYG